MFWLYNPVKAVLQWGFLLMVKRIARILLATALFLLALLALWAGLQTPAYLRAVAPGVLEVAGESGRSLVDEALLQIEFGRSGSASRMLKAQEELLDQVSDPVSVAKEIEEGRKALLALEEAHPDYVFSGGADPFFEQFVRLLPRKPNADSERNVNSLLATQVNRKALLGFLESSSNPAVQRILRTRNLYTLRHFAPVDQPGGEAYDAAVLMTALLAQGGHFRVEFVSGLRDLLQKAEAGDPDALQRMESLYMAMLGAGQRMNWGQLAVGVGVHERWEDFVRTASQLRSEKMPLDQLYSVVVLSGDGGKVADYLEFWPESGHEDLAFAVAQGSGALALLLEKMQPVYRPPAWREWIPDWLGKYSSRLVYDFPRGAVVMAALLYGLSGILFYNAFRCLFAGGTRSIPWFSRFARNSVAALLVVVIMLSANEPSLFSQATTEPGRQFLEFELTPEALNIQEKNMDTANIDQSTLVILLVYFLIQLFIYTVCLYKVYQISRMPIPSELKIRLLENEEQLFDLGLYVGLAGTVISLLMLAMGIVQASLVAAYSSTLFGILFVALLKILHVRPLKRKLLVEADRY